MKDTRQKEFSVHSCSEIYQDSDFASVNSAVLSRLKRVVMDRRRSETNFLWFIENYSCYSLINGEYLYSPLFAAEGLEGNTWRLFLFPRGRRVEDKGHISFYLRCDHGQEYASIMYELSVLAADGSVICSKERDGSFGGGYMRGWDDFLLLDEILFQRDFPQDILTVRCKIWRGEGNVRRISHLSARTRIGIENVSFEHEVENFSTLLSNLENDDSKEEKASAYPSVSEDMKAPYVNQCLSDVELKTKTKSFPAHKSVLCARSVVFTAMLNNSIKEKNTDRVEVDDLSDDVMQQMLLFLYSDTVESLQWEMATQLYYAADKYQVDKLKEVCSSFLLANLCPTNAGELLLLADTHSDGDLKKSVEDFILEHEKEVFGSKEWEMLMETNPVLVMKTMHLKYKR